MAESDRTKWNARHDARGAELHAPSPFLMSMAPKLPARGRALDLAGGTGRHALWLAKHGLDVTLVDISDVALARAQRAARDESVALRTLRVDLEREGFPRGPWDIIVIVDFLFRPILAAAAGELARGGYLIVAHPTFKNLQRHARPGARYLLKVGELPRLVEGLDIMHFDEGWNESGRHEARILARRKP